MNVKRSPVTTRDGRVGGILYTPTAIDTAAPLIVCIHGSGCNSNYFDLRGNSLVEEAARRAMPTLLVDRPGHGESAAPRAGSTINRGAAAVIALVETICAAQPELAARPLALIGHSFGGAVALVVAARRTKAGRLPTAICVSGIGDRPDAGYSVRPPDSNASVSRPPAPYWLFGPGRTYDWRGVMALRAAAEPWRHDEIDELRKYWPTRWTEVASQIKSAVHFRLAEYERIWETSPASIARISASFCHSPHVDAAVAPDGGHLYEVHLRGAELVAAQLEFLQAVNITPWIVQKDCATF